jgi:hypothetical protein
MAALEDIRARQQEQSTLPSERLVDSGYVSGELLNDGRTEYGEELAGPIRGTGTPQAKIPDGLSHADFQVDWEGKHVTCPAGHTAVIPQWVSAPSCKHCSRCGCAGSARSSCAAARARSRPDAALRPHHQVIDAFLTGAAFVPFHNRLPGAALGSWPQQVDRSMRELDLYLI